MTHENENIEQQSESIPSGPGSELREAREALNLSQQQVATQLRMQLRIIEALESDDYSGLPGATFVQGYLRSYARLLGLPEEKIVALGASKGDEPELVGSIYDGNVESSSSDLPFRLISFLVLLVVVVGLGWWFSQQTPSPDVINFQQESSSGAEQGLLLPAESATAEADDEALTESDGSEMVETTAPEQDEISAPPAEQDSDPELVEAESGPQSEPQSEPAVVVAAPQPVTPPEEPAPAVPPGVPELTDAMPQAMLEIQYQADSWSEVNDAAGRNLVYGLIPAGKKLTLRGEAPFKVFFGYANGVTVYYNGVLYDHSPYQRGDVARFRIGRAEHNKPLSGN